MKDTDNATLLLFPGMIFQVLSVSEAKPVIIDESQRDALVQDLSKEIEMKVDKSSTESINGRMWLIIEGSKDFKGSEARARVAITSADGKMYLVYAFSSDKFFAEAVSVSKVLVSSFSIQKKQ
jgi:hypothetical protein